MTEAVKTRTKKPLPPMPRVGFARLEQILAVFPVSPSAWWDGVRKGKYPQPYKIGPATTAWRAEDVWALIEATPLADQVSPHVAACQQAKRAAKEALS